MTGFLTRNQYLITERGPTYRPASDNLPADGRTMSLSWNDLTVTWWAPLEVTADHRGLESTVLLIGYALDPARPSLSNGEIAAGLATSRDLWGSISRLSGRFVLLIREEHGADGIYAVTDAASQRQLYFWTATGELVLSSMPELILDHFGDSIRLEDAVQTLCRSPAYRRNGLPWFGSTWYDRRIHRLLPNHALRLKDRTVTRVPLQLPSTMDAEESIGQAAEILTGSVTAVHQRYEVQQPLTAGFDSRAVLAASRDHRASTSYFIFDRGTSTRADVKTAVRLGARLGLSLRVIPVAPKASQEFQRIHQQAFEISTTGPLLANVEHHYRCNRDRDVVVIMGNAGEVARNRFIEPAAGYSLPDYLMRAFGGVTVFREGISAWCAEVEASELIDPELHPLDLFYWEQYLPYNKSRITTENDLAIETFLPFNNRWLLLLLLSTPEKWRDGPTYPLFVRLCERLWSDTLSEPFNPLRGFALRKRLSRAVFKHGWLSRHLIGHYHRIGNLIRPNRWTL